VNDGTGGVRIGLVLSGGGLRGAAHVGVIAALARYGVPIDVVVGVSAGAVVAAYYAAVGLEVDEFLADARAFRGRHLIAHSLAVNVPRGERALAACSGVIPRRLRQLEAAVFNRLHHGVQGLGIVCHDWNANRPRHFATGSHHDVPLAAVVRASAAIPYLFPPHAVVRGGERWLLTDGGVSDPVPVAFARRPPLSATHLIVSDCRWMRDALPADSERAIWLRPRMMSTGTLWAPRRGLLAAVAQGEAAVTPAVVERIHRWLDARQVAARASA
jgi:NTE family protein